MEISTYVGFDVSNSSIAVAAVDPLGHRLRQEKLGTSDEEIQRFLTDLPRPPWVVLEACNVWEHIYDATAATGAEVLLANPFQTKLVSKTTLKTDRVDSEKLAKLARLDAAPEAHVPSRNNGLFASWSASGCTTPSCGPGWRTTSTPSFSRRESPSVRASCNSARCGRA